jgi:hypothetical protein
VAYQFTCEGRGYIMAKDDNAIDRSEALGSAGDFRQAAVQLRESAQGFAESANGDRHASLTASTPRSLPTSLRPPRSSTRRNSRGGRPATSAWAGGRADQAETILVPIFRRAFRAKSLHQPDLLRKSAAASFEPASAKYL